MKNIREEFLPVSVVNSPEKTIFRSTSTKFKEPGRTARLENLLQMERNI